MEKFLQTILIQVTKKAAEICSSEDRSSVTIEDLNEAMDDLDLNHVWMADTKDTEDNETSTVSSSQQIYPQISPVNTQELPFEQTLHSSPILNSGPKPQTFESALTYLHTIKVTCSDKPEIYAQFLDLMKRFKAQSIDHAGVVAKAMELFSDYPNLISGLRLFIPPGLSVDEHPVPAEQSISHSEPIQSSVSPGKPEVTFERAREYVNKVKLTYADSPQTFKSFLEIFRTGNLERKVLAKTYEDVQVLFKDHPELIVEFLSFLPGGTKL